MIQPNGHNHLDITEVEVGAYGPKDSTTLDRACLQQLVIVGIKVETVDVLLGQVRDAWLPLQSSGLILGTLKDVLLKGGLEALVVLVQCFKNPPELGGRVGGQISPRENIINSGNIMWFDKCSDFLRFSCKCSDNARII